jgi:hypothetical protein
VVVVEPLNLELLNGLNGLNIAKRLNFLNRRRGTGVALVERTQQNPYGLVVSAVEQAEASTESPPSKKPER